MNLKQRPTDFHVRERLRDGVIGPSGKNRVYRVRKRKRTSLEAAAELARAAGVAAGEVALAGMKDRQGVTEQFMSIPSGRPVRIDTAELRVEPVGFCTEPLGSADSLGNEFEITLRRLTRGDVAQLERQVPWVAREGLPNYFDEQRFGNVTHGQGWIARDLVEGRVEHALQRLITAVSPATPERERRFRVALRKHWGDWRSCRDIAGKLGAHHSVFEHLAREPEDFRGAFSRVSLRLRLIHLYAYQSHLWNRAVVRHLRWSAKRRRLLSVPGVEGPLVFYAEERPEGWTSASTFWLPGPGLEDVVDPEQRRAYELVLERERLRPEHLRIDGIGGFQFKGEGRGLVLVPADLDVTRAGPDPLHPGSRALTLRFALARGAYATLVVKRLLARSGGRRGAGGAPAAAVRGGARELRPGQGATRRGPAGEKRARDGDGAARSRYSAGPAESGDRRTQRSARTAKGWTAKARTGTRPRGRDASE